MPVIPKGRLIIIGAAFLIIVIGVAIIFLGARKDNGVSNVTLTLWGVESPTAIQAITNVLPKNFKVTYRAFDPKTYESELVNALAAGKGPDVFMIHSSWLPKHADKLIPASPDQISSATFSTLFPTVVAQDFAPDGYVYALPLYIDTLALIYNRDVFDTKGIALPPKTWKELESDIPKLRSTDSTGKLVKAAFAIGGSEKSISHASDLISTLFLQSGVPMVANDFSRATFAQAGRAPLLFYTKFGNPGDPLYTWNANLKYSIDAFAAGDVAGIINYADTLKTIKEKNPFLHVAIAPLPQPSDATLEVNYASYWGIAVSNRFQDSAGAWNFIKTIFTDPTILRSYGEAGSRLPALRTILAEKANDPTWGVFAKQALSARSWPQVDNALITESFSKMIEDVLSGTTPDAALKKSEDAVSGLMQKKHI